MAKRFTDSEKWQDDWFFNLDQCGKLSWLYIIDHCDHAGFWKKNIKLLNFNTGCNYVEDELLQIFNSRIIQIEDKWFIPKFITFQYGNKFATSKQKPVQSAIEILRKFNLIQEDTNGNITLSLPNGNPNLTLPIGLPNPKVTLMDMDMDMEMNMDMVKKMEMDTNMDKKTELDKELEKDKKIKLIYERMNIFSKIKSKGYDSLTQQEKDRFEELEKIK